ncbi:hypothetical protein [Dactylococcopsis salina]|nr:hypothetical protein [Dactylococcopsis salina]
MSRSDRPSDLGLINQSLDRAPRTDAKPRSRIFRKVSNMSSLISY